MLKKLLLAAFATIASLAAQTAPCLSFNDSNNNSNGSVTGYGFGGPNTRAWQITPTAPATIESVRLFTANTLLATAYMTVEIWSDVANLPGVRLAGGTWKIDQSLPRHWQGANLDASVAFGTGQKYWLVWIDPGFSEFPIETGALTLPVVTRSSPTAAWVTAASGSALKVRFYCNRLDDLGIGNTGGSCLGTNGVYPAAFTNHEPTVGNTLFSIEGTGFLSGTACFMILGVQPFWPSIPLPVLPAGCQQNADLFDSYFGFAGTGNTRGPTANGHVRYPLSIPNDPGLVGGFIGCQVAGFDTATGAAIPLVTTNAVTVVIR
jgi:hypothetical protein